MALFAYTFFHKWHTCNALFVLHYQGDKARVIQTLLFVAGLNTLLQALFGTRLPAVVGGSFAYVIPIFYIINDSSLRQIEEPHVVVSQSLTSQNVFRILWYNSARNAISWINSSTDAIQWWTHVTVLQRFIQTMRAIQGSLIVASSIQIILGYSQVWGIFSRYCVKLPHFFCSILLKFYWIIFNSCFTDSLVPLEWLLL